VVAAAVVAVEGVAFVTLFVVSSADPAVVNVSLVAAVAVKVAGQTVLADRTAIPSMIGSYHHHVVRLSQGWQKLRFLRKCF